MTTLEQSGGAWWDGDRCYWWDGDVVGGMVLLLLVGWCCCWWDGVVVGAWDGDVVGGMVLLLVGWCCCWWDGVVVGCRILASILYLGRVCKFPGCAHVNCLE